MSDLPYAAAMATVGHAGGDRSAGPGAMTPTIVTPQGILLFDADETAAHCIRDDAQGSPLPPCQLQQRPGLLRDIWVPVTADVPITITIDCRYSPDADPRPRLVVRANPAVGLTADVEAVAPAGTGWVTLSATVTPTADGVVNVWRELRHPAAGAVARWDNLQTLEG